MRFCTSVFKRWLLVLTGIVPAVLLAAAFVLPPVYEETFLGELRHKLERLRETPGKRIVIIGGSSAAFGIDSAMIERELPKYAAVNMGMYAGLGSRVLLDLCAGQIREGDIVLLCPEPEKGSLSGIPDAGYLWQASDGAFGMLLQLSPEEKTLRSLAGTFPEFAATKLRCFLSGDSVHPDGIYRRDSFDAYGDIVNPLCSRNILPEEYDPNNPVSFSGSLLEEAFWDAAKRFARKMENRGARVWYRLCPVNKLAVSLEGTADTFCRELRNRTGIPVAGDPGKCVMDPEWFFDTNFHLNQAGKKVYTTQLVRDLKAMLGDSSPTEDETVTPPKTLASDVQPAADREGGTPADDPDVRINAQMYAGDREITFVDIPETVRWIEDGAFEGCTSLKRIRLHSMQPSAIIVGTELLRGTTAYLEVPEESLSAYRTDYRFSIYADRIRSYETD